MMKNSLIKIIICCLLGWVLLAPTPAGAEICSEEQIKEIEKNIKKNAQEYMTASKSLLDNYNNAARQYVSSCNPNVNLGTPVYWSQDALSAAFAADQGSAAALLSDKSQYQFTGINWSGESPTTQTCANLKAQAANLLSQFKRIRVTTTAILGKAGATTAPRACLCSANADNQECITYADSSPIPMESRDGCKTFSEYMSDMANCPLCSVFQVILNTDADVAQVSWDATADPLRGVVSIFFLVILARETLKIVSNLGGSSISSYLKTILGLGLKVAIILIMLGNSTYIYNYFVSPVIKGGLEMGLAFLKMGADHGGCVIGAGTGTFGTVGGGVLDSSLLSSIMDTVRCFNNSALVMPAVGRSLICHGWANGGSIWDGGSLLPDLSMWFSGVVTYAFGMFIWLAITFYLIDCTVQLGMVSAFVPLFLACWPFEMTKRYAITGVKMVLNTFFNFVLMGVVMLVGVEIVSFALTAGSDDGMDMNSYITLLNSSGDNLDQLKQMSSLDGESILILIACCIMAMKLIEIANKAADKFSAGSGSKIGAKMGGTAMSAAHKATAAGGKLVWSSAKSFGNIMINNTSAGRGLKKFGKGVKNVATYLPRKAYTGVTVTGAAWAGKKLGLEKYQGQQSGSGKEGAQGSGNKGPVNGAALGDTNIDYMDLRNKGNNDSNQRPLGQGGSGGNNNGPVNGAALGDTNIDYMDLRDKK